MSDPRIPVWTWREAILKADVPPLTKLICHTLAAYLNDVGQCCWPTVETLMQQTGMGNKAVAVHLKKAVAAGLLSIERQRTKDGRLQKNVYRPRFPKHVKTTDVPATRGESQMSEGHEAKQGVQETSGPDVLQGVSQVSEGHGNSPYLTTQDTTDDRATDPHALWGKLSDAANGALYPLALGLQVVSEPIGWIKAGADLELDILPTVRAMAGRCKHHSIRSWSYFAGAVSDARDRRLKGLPAPSLDPPMRPPSRSEARIAKAREFKALAQRMVDEAKTQRTPQ